MDSAYKRRHILRLTGVKLGDDYVPVEDVADSRLMESAADATDGQACEPPDKIPRVFTGLENWPMRTNLKCWMCDFTFDNSPKFVVQYAGIGENGGIEFGVLGNMCTFNCAELWIETNLGGRASNEERWRYQDNLCLAYLMFTGRRVARIKPAPAKTELKAYGGELDEDAFWKRMRELDPMFGLRDHTLGSIIPERDRQHCVAVALRSRANSVSVSPTAGAGDIWALCGVPPPVGLSLPDSVAVEAAPAGAPAPPAMTAANSLPSAKVSPTAKTALPAAKAAAPSAKTTLPTAKAALPSAKATAPSAKATTPSVKVTAPTAKAVTPPAAKVMAPTAKEIPPSAKATPPPAKETPPSAKATPPSAKAATPPSMNSDTVALSTDLDELMANIIAL